MTSFNPTSASRAVLIEVMNVLGAFRDEIVLVGGWVPDLLYPGRGHMGSLDVDLAISPRALGRDAYQTILKRMLEAGYSHQTSPTHFLKKVEGVEKPVKVDLRCRFIEEGRQPKVSWPSAAASPGRIRPSPIDTCLHATTRNSFVPTCRRMLVDEFLHSIGRKDMA